MGLDERDPSLGASGTHPAAIGWVHPSTAPHREGKGHLIELRVFYQEGPKKVIREEAAFAPQCPAFLLVLVHNLWGWWE